jgi:hypothetical protein
LAELATETGVEAVLDFGRTVRFRHLRAMETTPQANNEESPE